MDRTTLLPIGQFAHASGLPITALRHYDSSGVLQPALVDPESGYRYYRRDQLASAQLIRSLRQLDIPIEQVRGLMARRAAGQDISAALCEHMAAVERRLEVQRAVAHTLLARISEGAEMNHRITIRQGSAVRALVCRATIDHFGLAPFMADSYQAMYTAAGRGPLSFNSPAFNRYHGLVSEESSAVVEACLPFSATGAQPTDLPEGMSVLDIPETMLACTVVEGPDTEYPAIHTAYDAVAAWISEHGFTFAGPVRQIFRRWCGPGHPDNIVEIAWPIEDATA